MALPAGSFEAPILCIAAPLELLSCPRLLDPKPLELPLLPLLLLLKKVLGAPLEALALERAGVFGLEAPLLLED